VEDGGRNARALAARRQGLERALMRSRPSHAPRCRQRVNVTDIVNGELTPLGWMDSLGQLYRCNKVRRRAPRAAPAHLPQRHAGAQAPLLLLTRAVAAAAAAARHRPQLLGTGSHAVSSVLSMAKKYPRVLLLHDDSLLCCKLDEMENCSYKWNKKARTGGCRRAATVPADRRPLFAPPPPATAS
jgi:hypothetical protein